MNIKKYDGKSIKLTDIDNQIFIGIGKYITSGDNEDLGEAFVVYDSNQWVQFIPSEIKSIEILKEQETSSKGTIVNK